MACYSPVTTLYWQAQGVTVFQIAVIKSISLVLSILLEISWGIVENKIGYRKNVAFCSMLRFVFKIVTGSTGCMYRCITKWVGEARSLAIFCCLLLSHIWHLDWRKLLYLLWCVFWSYVSRYDLPAFTDRNSKKWFKHKILPRPQVSMQYWLTVLRLGPILILTLDQIGVCCWHFYSVEGVVR